MKRQLRSEPAPSTRHPASLPARQSYSDLNAVCVDLNDTPGPGPKSTPPGAPGCAVCRGPLRKCSLAKAPRPPRMRPSRGSSPPHPPKAGRCPNPTPPPASSRPRSSPPTSTRRRPSTPASSASSASPAPATGTSSSASATRCSSLFDPAATERPPSGPPLPVPPHGARGPGHVAFAATAAELDRWRERLVAARVEIEADFLWPGGARSIYVRDPAGNSVELTEPRLWDFPPG